MESSSPVPLPGGGPSSPRTFKEAAMNPLRRRRLYQSARAIAAFVAVCTLVSVPVAVIHDGAVVKADIACRGRVWNELSVRRREENGGAIGHACTPALISALSSRAARSAEEKSCESVYYPQTTDTENGAILSSCHLTTRRVPEIGGFMLLSTRAWRACAAATPGLEVCARDVWLLLLGVSPLLIVLGTRRWLV